MARNSHAPGAATALDIDAHVVVFVEGQLHALAARALQQLGAELRQRFLGHRGADDAEVGADGSV
jgi:hypothetical protein